MKAGNLGGVVIFMCLVAAAAAAEQPMATSVLGHEMAAYSAADGSFSFLYPKGWTVTAQQSGVSIAKKPGDPKGAYIDLLVFQPESPMTAQRVVEVLEEKMKEKYPSFSENTGRGLSPGSGVRRGAGCPSAGCVHWM